MSRSRLLAEMEDQAAAIKLHTIEKDTSVLNSLPSPVKYLNLKSFFRSKHLTTERSNLKKTRFIAKDRLVCAWNQSDSVKTET